MQRPHPRPRVRPTARTTRTATSVRDHRSTSAPALDDAALATVRGGNPSADLSITAEDDWEPPVV